jgi:hypothetical protein
MLATDYGTVEVVDMRLRNSASVEMRNKAGDFFAVFIAK